MAVSKSHYELLGIPSNSDGNILKKAFYRLSKDLHPDTTLLPVKEAAKQFHQVCEAYEVLSDPIKRKAYDQSLKECNFINDVDEINSIDFYVNTNVKKIDGIGNRRPLSGSELYSLLLLLIAVFVSLFLAIGFAFLDGRALQIRPSWL